MTDNVTEPSAVQLTSNFLIACQTLNGFLARMADLEDPHFDLAHVEERKELESDVSLSALKLIAESPKDASEVAASALRALGEIS